MESPFFFNDLTTNDTTLNETLPSINLGGGGDVAGGEEEDIDCSSGFMYNVLMIVLFVFGTMGNIASVVVMRRPSIRRRAGSPALTVLVFVNTLGLFFNALSSVDDINSNYYGSMEAHIGPIGCKLLRYVPAVIQLMGHWVVVYITAQRFVAICMPRAESAFFRDRNCKAVFSSMFAVVAATQLWRPYLDTQEPATYQNSSNGSLILDTPAMCTAEQLGIYIDIESFFYQLGLLFLIPAILILAMNTCVILKLYQDYHRNRRIARERSARQSQRRMSSARDPMITATANSFLEEMENLSGAQPIERKLRKATIVLLAVTCTFWIYIMPHLFLLLYVRLNELVNGRLDGYNAFMRVCKALNVTSFLATISSADYILIQLIFDDMFRLELKFMVYRLFGRCSLRCQYLYIRERQKQRTRLESRCFQTLTGRQGPLSPTSNVLQRRPLGAGMPISAAIVSTTSAHFDEEVAAARSSAGGTVRSTSSGATATPPSVDITNLAFRPVTTSFAPIELPAMPQRPNQIAIRGGRSSQPSSPNAIRSVTFGGRQQVRQSFSAQHFLVPSSPTSDSLLESSDITYKETTT